MADAGITLQTATDRLTLYLAAEAKVLKGQSYEIGDRKLTRADLGEIRSGIMFWQGRIDALGGTAPRARRLGQLHRSARARRRPRLHDPLIRPNP